MYSVIGLWIAAGLLIIAAVAIVISGIRGVINGNQDYKKIGSILVPFIIFAISYLIWGTWIEAGIITMFCMMALMIVAIAFTGIRGAFN